MRNEIYVAGDSYEDKDIVSGTLYQVQSLDGDELQYDTFDVVVVPGRYVQPYLQTQDGYEYHTVDDEPVGVGDLIWVETCDPNVYKYGAEVVYRHKGVLVGKYYMSKLTRIGKARYKIECISPVGLLARSQHYGGIYPSGTGIAFGELLTDIVGGIIPFTVAPELENQLVYGWLPVATRRDNLHQALFAMGVSAQKDENGELYFAPLSDETATAIPDSRVYIDGSVSYPEATTKVSVVEHTYTSSDGDEVVTLTYDTVEAMDLVTPEGVTTQGSLILFDDPMHDLTVENSEVIESGANYAVLAAGTQVKLTGKKYTHTVRQITRQMEEDTESEVTVSDASLISIANGEAVADRLMSYYSSAKTITTDIALADEKAGSAVQITDPFGDVTKGIIKSLDINVSGTLKARAEIVADYSPGGAGNYYNDVAVVTEDCTWTASADGRVRIILIGGGSGGSSGGCGEDGNVGGSTLFSQRVYGGAGGAGGVAGYGGSGGRIFAASFDVTAGDTFAIQIGAGGAGGISDGSGCVPGSEGDATTFGDYTSADGTESATGYYDPFNAIAYALPGGEGMKGSDGDGYGSTSDTITIDGTTYICGTKGAYSDDVYWDDSSYAWGEGGYGGGASSGGNGGDGEDGSARKASNGFVSAYGGDGGAGGNATIPGVSADHYGNGGSGGNGGGGGGGGGGGRLYASGSSYQISVTGGAGGAGGTGSDGGQGAQGCVLIYY